MPISFACQNCGKRLKAPDNAVGKTSKCPQCHRPVTCPKPRKPARPIEEPDVPEILDDVDPYADVAESNPYAAPRAREEDEPPRRSAVATGQKKKKRKRRKTAHSGYAGVWDRAAAEFIDGIVLTLIYVPLFFFWLLPAFNAAAPDPAQPPNPAVIWELIIHFQIVVYLIQGVYFAGMESSPYQATLGKMFVGAQVTDLQGYRISIPRAIGRFLVKTFFSGICYIGYIMAFFTEKTQTLHDKVAGTVVVK